MAALAARCPRRMASWFRCVRRLLTFRLELIRRSGFASKPAPTQASRMPTCRPARTSASRSLAITESSPPWRAGWKRRSRRSRDWKVECGV